MMRSKKWRNRFDNLSVRTLLSCFGLWVIFLNICLLVGLQPLITQNRQVGLDFRTFYAASRIAGSRGDIYNVIHLNKVARYSGVKGNTFPYLYPPFLAFAARPLARMEPLAAQRIWSYASIICASLSALLIVLMTYSSIRRASLEGTAQNKSRFLFVFLLCALLLFLLPFRHNLSLGQVNIFVLTLIVLALYFQQVGRNKLGASALAVAVLIKITPVLIGFLFLLRKRYHFALWCGLFILLFSVATLPFGALSSWIRFFEFVPGTSYGKHILGLIEPGDVRNISVAGVLARLFPKNPSLITTGSFTFAAALLGGILYKVLRRGESDLQDALLPLSVIMVVMAPFTYLHHVVYLFPGVVLTSLSLWTQRRNAFAKGSVGLLILLVVLAGLDFPSRYDQWGISTSAWGRFIALNPCLLIAIYGLSLACWPCSGKGRDERCECKSRRASPKARQSA